MSNTLKLPQTAYKWALKHLVLEGDTDLFPPMFEIQAIKYTWTEIIDELRKLDIGTYKWKGGRRFLVPKEQYFLRSATQLDPLDNIILAAIIKKYGSFIERIRLPLSDNRVFSYRFDPTSSGRFYGEKSYWEQFWKVSLDKAKKTKWVVVTDITDYYNQIYHHVLENQLRKAHIPEPACKALTTFISSLSQGVTRGIPVGPHATHLLAECALDPIDRSLLSHGLDFCRYVDDFHLFCETEEAAEIAIHDLAEILDQQQRLTVQRQKTKIMPSSEFQELAKTTLHGRPLNQREAQILAVIKAHARDDPYQTFGLEDLDDKDLDTISRENLDELLDIYLANIPESYPHIKWLLRRLTQIGAPGAIDAVLRNLIDFQPVLGDVARYLVRATANYTGDFAAAGQLLLTALEHPVAKHNDYIQVILINLFSRIPSLDHIDSLTAKYASVNPAVRREIVVVAGRSGHGHWIKERKDEFASADPWLRRAILQATSSLPGDEAKHWINKIKDRLEPLEKPVAKWTLKKKTMKLGEIKIT